MSVALIERTTSLVDELLPLWQEATKSEDTAALIARSVIDALLDLRAFTTEFDQVKAKAAA